ncbi:Insulin-like growth factor 2 mRNA-binding protein 1 [Sarcoptes scabiei]|nr:Insulin-like growth factor 2 mRNA-binding protein 1 [Sarcoptes scabiei]
MKCRLSYFAIYLVFGVCSMIILLTIIFSIYLVLAIFYQNTAIMVDDSNCTPMKVTLCQKFNVRYAYTKLPNRFGQTDQSIINEKLTSTYSTILGIKCYTLLPLFLCSQLVPPCNETGYAVPMCKQLCKDTKHRCDFFLDIFDIEWPDEIDCEELPDSNDPDVCVGNQQAMELNQIANRHFCKENGFRCDQTRCIPPTWKCDGYLDCNDSMDEKHCNNCLQDQFYCGHGVCIDRINICDGVSDCPDSRDERQCFRLSESMGLNGHGKLQVWNPIQNHFDEMCGEDWKIPDQSEKICHLLGYSRSNETRLQDEWNDLNEDKARRLFQNKFTSQMRFRERTHFLDSFNRNEGKCRDSEIIVHLKCQNFECGRPHYAQRKRRNVRIVGGEESYPGKWPWLVSFHGGPAEVFFCAGVLISEWWVLTAAHCIGTKSNVTGWTINLGVTRRTSSPLFVRQREVAKLIKHPRFQMSLDYYYSDDIALVLLKEKVEFDEFLRPVCLPANSSVEVEPGTHCVVIGWGKKIHDDYADYQSAIHEVEVPIVPHQKCIQWYSKQLPFHPIPDTMVCAGYEQGKKDACQGDSGGPLLCTNEDQSWFVAGIVSWGINCAQPQLPGIYTNVPKYIDWIESVTSKHKKPIQSQEQTDLDINYDVFDVDDDLDLEY